MAGPSIGTWVKVKNKSGRMTSRVMANKFGGGSYQQGQVVTLSEYNAYKDISTASKRKKELINEIEPVMTQMDSLRRDIREGKSKVGTGRKLKENTGKLMSDDLSIARQELERVQAGGQRQKLNKKQLQKLEDDLEQATDKYYSMMGKLDGVDRDIAQARQRLESARRGGN